MKYRTAYFQPEEGLVFLKQDPELNQEISISGASLRTKNIRGISPSLTTR
jgi:hypothetical protein